MKLEKKNEKNEINFKQNFMIDNIKIFLLKAQQLFAMFPQTSQTDIVQDLQRTHSVEATADNILEGLLSVKTSFIRRIDL